MPLRFADRSDDAPPWLHQWQLASSSAKQKAMQQILLAHGAKKQSLCQQRLAEMMAQVNAQENLKGGMDEASRQRVVQTALEDPKNVGFQWFAFAASNGDTNVVRALLAHTGVDVNQARTGTGITPLYMACQEGHERVVRLLLENAATDVNQATTGTGSTPLFMACHQGHEGVVRLLLGNAATAVNQARTDTGSTPLYKACQNGHEGVVRLLLEDARTTRPTEQQYDSTTWPFYVAALKNLRRTRNARFRGLIRATIAFNRIRLKAAQVIYAPGGAGAAAAAASFYKASQELQPRP